MAHAQSKCGKEATTSRCYMAVVFQIVSRPYLERIAGYPTVCSYAQIGRPVHTRADRLYTLLQKLG
jgi:hypothetical protein